MIKEYRKGRRFIRLSLVSAGQYRLDSSEKTIGYFDNKESALNALISVRDSFWR